MTATAPRPSLHDTRWQLWMDFDRRVLPLASLLAMLPLAAHGQVVVPAQPLSFGPLIGGVAETVAPTDAARRADITIQGTSNSDASLLLILPSALEAPNGATIPLQFRWGDVVFESPTSGGQQPVELAGTTTIRLHRNKPGRLYIGGRALPAAAQRAGTYSATIVVVVAPAGA